MIAPMMPAVLPAAVIPTIAGLIGGLPVASPEVAQATAMGLPPAPAADFAQALATAQQAPVPVPSANPAAVVAAPVGETEDQAAGLADDEMASFSEQPPVDLPAPLEAWASLLVPELLRLPPPAAPPTQPAQPRPALLAVAGGAAPPRRAEMPTAQPARLIEARLPPAPALPPPDAKAAASPLPLILAPMQPPPALVQLETAQPVPTLAVAPPLWTPPPAPRAALPAITALPAPRGPGGANWQRSLPAAAPPVVASPAPAEIPAPATISLPEPPAQTAPPTASPVLVSVPIAAAIRPRLARAEPAEAVGPAAAPNLPPTPAFPPPPGHLPPPMPAAPPPDGPPIARAVLPDPAASGLAIASDRLGLVQVEVAGDAAGLAVSLASPAPAAPIIDAAAPRLAQDLAQAGITLSALSINGQRSDLGGGQRQPRRGPQAEAVAALGRNPSARLNRPATPSTDRFA